MATGRETGCDTSSRRPTSLILIGSTRSMRAHGRNSVSCEAALRIVRSALLTLAFGFPFLLMLGKSVTSDEVAHIPAGYSYLRTGRITLNPMHPPLVKELCALPLLFMDLPMPADEPTIEAMARDIRYQ